MTNPLGKKNDFRSQAQYWKSSNRAWNLKSSA